MSTLHTYRASCFYNEAPDAEDVGWFSSHPLRHVVSIDVEAPNPEAALIAVLDKTNGMLEQPLGIGDVIALHMREAPGSWLLTGVAAYAIKPDAGYDTLAYRNMNIQAKQLPDINEGYKS